MVRRASGYLIAWLGHGGVAGVAAGWVGTPLHGCFAAQSEELVGLRGGSG